MSHFVVSSNTINLLQWCCRAFTGALGNYIAVLFMLSCYFCEAQTKRLNQSAQFWPEINLSGKIAPKWKWQFEAQHRRMSPWESPSMFKYTLQFSFRPWIHFNPTPNIRISAFVGLLYNFGIPENNAREFPEIRAAVQAIFFTRGKYNLLINRLRPEIRNILNRDRHFETVFRFRYMLRYQRIFSSKGYDKNTFYFIASNEILINGTGAVTGYHVFDQNRLFAGMGYNITKSIAIETGYTNQFFQHINDANFNMNHLWNVALFVNNLNPKRKPKAK